KCRGIHAAVLLEAVARARPKLFEVPTSLSHSDDRHVQVTAFDHCLQRWEDLLVSQIARSAEKHQGIGIGITHLKVLFPDYLPATSTCPPKPKRIAESSLS